MKVYRLPVHLFATGNCRLCYLSFNALVTDKLFTPAGKMAQNDQ